MLRFFTLLILLAPAPTLAASSEDPSVEEGYQQRQALERFVPGLEDLDGRRTLLQELIFQKPNRHGARMELAWLELAAGQGEEASKHFSKLAELDVFRGEALEGLAALALWNGELSQAIETLTKKSEQLSTPQTRWLGTFLHQQATDYFEPLEPSLTWATPALSTPAPSLSSSKTLGALEWTGGRAAAVLDANGDGWPDLLVANNEGLRLMLMTPTGFQDATEARGLSDLATASVLAVGDYDLDGLADIYLGRQGPNGEPAPQALLRNAGARFVESTPALALQDEVAVSAAHWVDIDNDGDLDLYVATGPNSAAPDKLWRNDRVAFVEIAGKLGLKGPTQALDAQVAVIDATGLPVFLVVEPQRTRLFVYEKKRFKDRAEDRGLPQGGQAAAFWDPDGDGDLDLVMTRSMPRSTEYRLRESAPQSVGLLDLRNDGMGSFAPTTSEISSFAGCGTRLELADLNGDGLDDLVVAGSSPFLGQPQLARALVVGVGEVPLGAGSELPALDLLDVSALRAADWNRDGQTDLLLLRDGPWPLQARTPLLLTTSSETPVLRLRLLGPKGQSALGASARLDGLTSARTQRVLGGSGAGARGDALLLRAPKGETAVGLNLRWPDGSTAYYENPPTGMGLRAVQGDPALYPDLPACWQDAPAPTDPSHPPGTLGPCPAPEEDASPQ